MDLIIVSLSAEVRSLLKNSNYVGVETWEPTSLTRGLYD
jgi:hypothetical protein